MCQSVLKTGAAANIWAWLTSDILHMMQGWGFWWRILYHNMLICSPQKWWWWQLFENCAVTADVASLRQAKSPQSLTPLPNTLGNWRWWKLWGGRGWHFWKSWTLAKHPCQLILKKVTMMRRITFLIFNVRSLSYITLLHIPKVWQAALGYEVMGWGHGFNSTRQNQSDQSCGGNY